ncbi:PD-(D/E)XK nuclease family protein [Galbibacter sp. EGI 63066]|uniref:PD-(D/E)XK nuclease family protein n=1 Tax=Galbibacter sp. EGI 63066 TaxID=2993559 RepID=UPI002248CF33|nr:PD-(D/E)XK nuclease family protein [Galbibacter sp. EGI 63066]MCX2678940.1 PD-(D/E)XK nuclease family protein [Galbibacter sp. EGI 63066]
MKSFLAQVAEQIHKHHENELSSLVFILPSKRAGTFLKNALKKIVTKTIIAPKIISIEEFVQELANLKPASNIQLSFEFYEVYKKLTPENEIEDFYSFTSWSQIILQDFNEIDRYLIDPDKIFTHLFHIKELDQFHWTNDDHKTEIQLNYLKFWKKIHLYYTAFYEHLMKKGMGYQGMIYREANENVEHYIQNHINEKHFFIGFNALNNSEKNIVQEFLANTPSEIFWDIDTEFLDDIDHDAGLFMRNYKNQWPYFKKHPFDIVCNHFSKEKSIEIAGIPKNVSQAKYVGSLLKSLGNNIQSTAVVLGNENLLAPVLNAVPPEINKVNVTSGFPLQLTPFASFYEVLLDIWERNKGELWYYQDVLNILSNPICKTLLANSFNQTQVLLDRIKKENLIYIKQEEVGSIGSNATHLFPEPDKRTVSNSIQHCIEITLLLKESYKTEENKNPLFLEYLFRFYEVFNQLNTYSKQFNSISTLATLKKIYSELLSKETVDFKGEPLEGLQIMGMLESRNLDFETVIITSVNEGILPAGKTNSSFIPFNLKIAFGLPTYKEKDAIYTYHFYRLLQRAKNIYLLYNTEPDVLEGGEKSRLLQQLTMLKQENHRIKEVVASPSIKNDKLSLATLNKNNDLLEKLKEVATGKGFSPTSLSNFIRNPFDFYKQTVLKIKEADDVEETIAANTLGTIVHDTLELFYKPLEGQFLTLSHIKEMRTKVEKQVSQHFAKSYSVIENLKGKNLISYHIAKRYIENFLDFEERRLKKGKQIKILEVESKLKTKIHIDGFDFPIYLQGKVDRVEEEDGVINIIDYKTGKVQQGEVEIVDWENLTEDYKYSKAFQVLCYAYMMKNESPFNQFQGGIISFKNLQSDILKFAKKDKAGRGAKKDHTIDDNVIAKFNSQLQVLIQSIFDIHSPFQEKEVKTHTY